MQPLNYTRKFLKYLTENRIIFENFIIESQNDHTVPKYWVDRLKETLYVLEKAMPSAIKFILPEKGKILNDNAYKALNDEDGIHLPYKNFVLEYPFSSGSIDSRKEYVSPNRIVFVQDFSQEYFAFVPIYHVPIKKLWIFQPFITVPKKNCIVRKHMEVNGLSGIVVAADELIPPEDYMGECRAVFEFLNALNCTNVSPQSIGKTNNGKHKKMTLPFDEYHLLTISGSRHQSTKYDGGSHASPREHLRRGHVRKLHSGVNIWVNACVVNAGTKGKITKDYIVTRPIG